MIDDHSQGVRRCPSRTPRALRHASHVVRRPRLTQKGSPEVMTKKRAHMSNAGAWVNPIPNSAPAPSLRRRARDGGRHTTHDATGVSEASCRVQACAWCECLRAESAPPRRRCSHHLLQAEGERLAGARRISLLRAVALGSRDEPTCASLRAMARYGDRHASIRATSGFT